MRNEDDYWPMMVLAMLLGAVIGSGLLLAAIAVFGINQ